MGTKDDHLQSISECPDCASENIVHSTMRDQVICRDCGLVFEPFTPMDIKPVAVKARAAPVKAKRAKPAKKAKIKRAKKAKKIKVKRAKPAKKAKKAKPAKKAKKSKSKSKKFGWW